MGNLGVRISAWVLLVLVTAGCTTSQVETPPSADAGASTERSDSAQPASRAYDAEELESAMPRAGQQVRGFKIVSRCRLLRAVCEGQVDRDFLYVAASDEKLNSWEVFVALQGDPPVSAVRNARRSCTDERANRPMRWIDKAVGSYSPGFRGTVTRDDWSYAGWVGRLCTLRGVSLWPEGKRSEPSTDFDASLFNGHHILTTRGRTLRETKALAKEYLDRLGK